MSKIGVFVDAGYFWVQATHVVHGARTARETIVVDYPSLRQEVLAQAAAQFPNAELLRVYWYDGPGPNGGKAASHLAIEELDDFKLRLGTRNGAGAQKAVDGLIITDLIGLAQSRSISGALVLSGDADLTPGVIAAQGLGIRVHLLSMGPSNATSPFLRAEVDFKSHWADAVVEKFAGALPPAVAVAIPIPVVVGPVCSPDASVQVAATTAGEAVVGGVAPANFAQEIAEIVFSRRDPARIVPISGTGMLPSKVDSRLLGEGSKKVGRQLTEKERIAIREAFKKLIAAELVKNEPG